MSNAIKTKSLTKVFDDGTTALKRLSWNVPRGSVYGLLGRNGAGKTTTIRILMGLLKSTNGTASILGESMWKASATHRERVTYVSQDQTIPSWMTLNELCEYSSMLYARWDKKYADEIIERFGLVKALNRTVETLSGGEKRKVAITLALAPRADVIVMDEPAAGLDPIARREVIDELIDVLSNNDDRTVLLSTHIISDVERIADKIGILNEGRLILDESLQKIQSTVQRVQIIFENTCPSDFTIPNALQINIDGSVCNAIVHFKEESDIAEIQKMPNCRVQCFPLGLEDLFIEFVTNQTGGAS